jgi:transposase
VIDEVKMRDHRQVIEGISWKYRTGSPWRELPERFGPWQTAYERHSRRSADGTWARLWGQAMADADADARGELDWLLAADSTLLRVHQHGAAASPIGGNAATRQGPARTTPPSRGHGRTTKFRS